VLLDRVLPVLPVLQVLEGRYQTCRSRMSVEQIENKNIYMKYKIF
jgi:hypothetical protein